MTCFLPEVAGRLRSGVLLPPLPPGPRPGPARILIVPDKFKGTLTAAVACAAMAKGWQSARAADRLDLLPMSDGGDGFGEVLGRLFHARLRAVKTLDAAHRPLQAHWWWVADQKLAIIEAARVIGLAMLPPKKFHPFQLDTFGLGRVLQAAACAGASQCVIGIGGSATNDGGFGLAQALGWKFLDRSGQALDQWWQLGKLVCVVPPDHRCDMDIIVAVDVANPLLGRHGCTRVYGPQKGIRPADFALAEQCLRRLKTVLEQSAKLAPALQPRALAARVTIGSPGFLPSAGVTGGSSSWSFSFGLGLAKTPGAGAAGGLGFGLMAFAGAKPRSGFEVFADAARLEARIRRSDVVLTGEGAVDRQTRMGKGVGQVMRLCRKLRIPCITLAGVVEGARGTPAPWSRTYALTDITTLAEAKRMPEHHLASLSALAAREGNFPQAT